MNTPNPFKPPDAPVADVGPRPAPSRGPIIALVIVGFLAVGWFVVVAPALFRLVDIGGMKPISGVLFLLAEVCLAIGLWRVFPSGLRGQRGFLLAITLQLLTRVSMGALSMPTEAHLPLLLASVVAVVGFAMVHARRRASREHA